MFRNSLSLLMVLVLAGGLFAFARTPPRVRRPLTRYVVKALFAAVHLAAQLAVIAAVGVAAVAIADAWSDGGGPSR